MVFESLSLTKGPAVARVALATVDDAEGGVVVASGVGSGSDTSDSLGGLTGGSLYRRVVDFCTPVVSSL